MARPLAEIMEYVLALAPADRRQLADAVYDSLPEDMQVELAP